MPKPNIDMEAARQAAARVTRPRRIWKLDDALAECRRVAKLHGADPDATVSAAISLIYQRKNNEIGPVRAHIDHR